LKIDHLSDVHQLAFDLPPIVLPAPVEHSLHKIVRSEGDLDSLQAMIDCDPVLIPDLVSRSFALTCAQGHGQRPFHHLPIVVAFYSLLVKAASDVVALYIESFVDQLRYPCRNTHFFSKLLLELFKLNVSTAEGQLLAEIITIALVRRAAVKPPHPWGLQVTIVELLSNPEIGFWEYHFVTANEKVNALLKAISMVFCN
jgi:hypothetical protein